jgi:hypothetical protein
VKSLYAWNMQALVSEGNNQGPALSTRVLLLPPPAQTTQTRTRIMYRTLEER